MSHIQLIYAFLLFWSIFREIHWKLLFLVKKLTISVRSSEILRIFFLNKFEKWKFGGKFEFVLNNPFCTKQKNGTNVNNNVFLHKISHIQLNYAFLLYWSIFWETHWKLLFLFQKMTISDRSTELLESLFS